MKQLLTHCSDELLPYYLLGLICGIRPKELQRLEWQHVNIDERHVYVPGSISKTWEHRYVEIPEILLAWLDVYGQDRCRSICPPSFASNHLADFGNLDSLHQAMGHRSSPQALWRHYHNARSKKDAAEFWAVAPSLRTGESEPCLLKAEEPQFHEHHYLMIENNPTLEL